MSYATCRGCADHFTKHGMGAQSFFSPRLCKDCALREVNFHGYHAPGEKCLDALLGPPPTKKEVLEGA